MGFSREVFNLWRVIKTVILILIILLIILAIYFFTGERGVNEEVVFGVTFSQLFAEQMGLDWKEAYLEMLSDLRVRKLRLIAYWEKVEPEKDQYCFEDMDWQIREAKKRGTEIILAVGRKLPRWPECHVPDWAEKMSENQQQEKLLALIGEIVNRYKDESAIKIWQVENEPFLKGFGECPPLDEEFLDKEMSLVRRLDTGRRPVMLTASGELSSWIEPAIKGDILGTSLYRTVWNEVLGHFRYPLPEIFYYKRANLVKWITGARKIFIIELQAEPWGPKMIWETEIKDQNKSMSLVDFKETVAYAKKTGFDETYLWGVEWWYQRKIRGDDSFWREAKTLFR